MSAILRSLAMACVLAVGLAVPARADFYDGLKAYQAGDFKAAEKHWRPLAKAGNARAQYAMGVLMEHYEDGILNPAKDVFFWLGKAAEQGLPSAQYELGSRYKERSCHFAVEWKECDLARHWLTLAARQGDDRAMGELIGIVWNPRYPRHDFKEAYFWASVRAIRSHWGPLEDEAVEIRKWVSDHEAAEAEEAAKVWWPERP